MSRQKKKTETQVFRVLYCGSDGSKVIYGKYQYTKGVKFATSAIWFAESRGKNDTSVTHYGYPFALITCRVGCGRTITVSLYLKKYFL